jgi:lipopolysaccharide transport system permease protein
MSRWAASVAVHQPRRAAPLSYFNPLAMCGNLWRRRELTGQFVLREIQGRYKGSYLGLFWSIANPLLMLSVFTFVFHYIFKATWTSPNEPVAVYAMNLYSGMIVFNIFAESAGKAPMLITSNPNFVKKVVFPLEILPVSLIGSALFHALLSLLILLAVSLLCGLGLHWTLVFLPLVLLPMLLLTAGVCWLLAAMGVFLRDTGHVIGVVVQLLFFVTPVCYPMSRLKNSAVLYRLMQFNPLAILVENFRHVVNAGTPPDWPSFGLTSVLCLFVAAAGYAWFMTLKRAFADVI